MPTINNFEIHAEKQTHKLITKLVFKDAPQLDPLASILDRLAKHFSNKPETINRIANANIPNTSTIIQALVRLATIYSPEQRHPEIKKWLSENIPWLDTNTQEHITSTSLAVLTYLEQWLEYSQAHIVLTKEQISMRIYRLLNCIIACLGTDAFFYAIQGPSTRDSRVAYLFVVAGCYTLLDHLIDDVVSAGQTHITKQAIGIFDWYITWLETEFPHCKPIPQYPPEQLSPMMQEYNRAIFWLICLLVRSGPLMEVVGIIRLCFNVEIRCFQEQTRSSQPHESIIQLGVLKGLSTGYLISQGILTPLYSEYSVLIQLLDDLSDYIADSQAGIHGFPICTSGIEEYAIFVGECLAEFIDGYTTCLARDQGLMLGGPNAAEYVIPTLIMYWIYCMCKTPQLTDLTRTCIVKLGLVDIIDPVLILESRREKHIALQNLWKITKQSKA